MASLGFLPYEMLAQIVGHIIRPTDLKSLCLSCKTLSAIATPVLYRNLVIPDDPYDRKRMGKKVKALINSTGIACVRTLYIGRCSVITTEAIDELLASLRDDSLCHFSFSEFSGNQFPTKTQSKYIWLHQKKFQNLHTGRFSWAVFDLIKRFPDEKGGFLSSVTELSYCLLRSCNSSSPCWPMDWINPLNLKKLELSLHSARNGPTVESLLTYRPFPNLTHLCIEKASIKDIDLNLAGFPHLTHLALRKCTFPPSGILIPDGKALKSLEMSYEELPPQFSYIEQTQANFVGILNRVRGLEIVDIHMCTSVSSESRASLANALQRHSVTLRTLIFKEARFFRENSPLTENSYIHLSNAIKACKKLTQLSLEIYDKIVIERAQDLIENLPNLITFSVDSIDESEAEPAARKLLAHAPASSKLLLICFRSGWWRDACSSGCTSRSFIKKGVEGRITEIDSKMAKHLIRESDIIQKGVGHGPKPRWIRFWGRPNPMSF